MQAAKPINATYKGDRGIPSGLLLPNPENTTCEVLVGVTLISSGSITQAHPGPATTTGKLVLQVESLQDDEMEVRIIRRLQAHQCCATAKDIRHYSRQEDKSCDRRLGKGP